MGQDRPQTARAGASLLARPLTQALAAERWKRTPRRQVYCQISRFPTDFSREKKEAAKPARTHIPDGTSFTRVMILRSRA